MRAEYVICWRNKQTGATGRGIRHVSYGFAIMRCNKLNKEFADTMEYWVEAA